MASGLSRIDWSAPWLAPWRTTGERMAQQVAQGYSVAEACNVELAAWHQLAQQASPAKSVCHVQFVSQDNLPEGMAYEQFIFEQHAVPTRPVLAAFP